MTQNTICKILEIRWWFWMIQRSFGGPPHANWSERPWACMRMPPPNRNPFSDQIPHEGNAKNCFQAEDNRKSVSLSSAFSFSQANIQHKQFVLKILSWLKGFRAILTRRRDHQCSVLRRLLPEKTPGVSQWQVSAPNAFGVILTLIITQDCLITCTRHPLTCGQSCDSQATTRNSFPSYTGDICWPLQFLKREFLGFACELAY